MSISTHLATLVAMPTITADTAANAAAINYLESYLKGRGLQCTRHEYNGRTALTARTSISKANKPKVSLGGHIDVVPGEPGQFTLQEKGGKLYGRGVYDMKFAIAGYLQLIDELYEEGTLHEYDFDIAITHDEEASAPLAGVDHLVQIGHRPEIVILPDSTAPGWDIEEIAKGWWRFELIATGKAVHSGRPWEGESASTKLVEALHELIAHYAGGGPTTDTLNIGSINGGGGIYNSVPDQMVANVEVRLTNEDSYPRAIKLLDELCAKYGLARETYTDLVPIRPKLDSPLVDAYRESVKAVTGRAPKGAISLGGSDAIFYTSVGIPCVLSCPLGGAHHSPTEWVSKESLEQFVPIMRNFLDSVARTAPKN
ncbi:MAG TPA: M20 family metallopeptidase [Candidatus Saccharimonadales bacterium]|nr:M20 family metallopeptidase [Candidatus Saccharimonadales bacterium]